jgi:hypothetical protein
LLGQQQAMRLRQFYWRDSEFRLHGPPELPRTDTQVLRKPVKATGVQRAGGDPLRGCFGQSRNGVDARAAGRELGAATKARPEPGTSVRRC